MCAHDLKFPTSLSSAFSLPTFFNFSSVLSAQSKGSCGLKGHVGIL